MWDIAGDKFVSLDENEILKVVILSLDENEILKVVNLSLDESKLKIVLFNDDDQEERGRI